MIKNKKIMGLCYGLAALTLLALWIQSPSPHEDVHEDHVHAHEEFVHLTPDQITEAEINTQTAGSGALKKQIYAPGKIILNENCVIHLIPKAPGIVVSANKNLGEEVQQGEILAVLESREVAEAKSNYIAAVKREQMKDRFYQQEKKLHASQISSEQEFFNSETSAIEAHIESELARQQLYALGFNDLDIKNIVNENPAQLRYYEIKAPFRGRVLYRHLTPGELLKPNEEVYVIADLSEVWVEINISSQELSSVKLGQSIEVKNNWGDHASGQITYLSPILSEETRTGKAIAVIDNKQNIWHPGTYVSTLIEGELMPTALVVPTHAIQKIDGHACVFVSQEGGFEIRRVEIGRCDGKSTEILSGLNNGENVATKNTFLLKADHEKDEAEHSH